MAEEKIDLNLNAKVEGGGSLASSGSPVPRQYEAPQWFKNFAYQGAPSPSPEKVAQDYQAYAEQRSRHREAAHAATPPKTPQAGPVGPQPIRPSATAASNPWAVDLSKPYSTSLAGGVTPKDLDSDLSSSAAAYSGKKTPTGPKLRTAEQIYDPVILSDREARMAEWKAKKKNYDEYHAGVDTHLVNPAWGPEVKKQFEEKYGGKGDKGPEDPGLSPVQVEQRGVAVSRRIARRGSSTARNLAAGVARSLPREARKGAISAVTSGAGRMVGAAASSIGPAVGAGVGAATGSGVLGSIAGGAAGGLATMAASAGPAGPVILALGAVAVVAGLAVKGLESLAHSTEILTKDLEKYSPQISGVMGYLKASQTIMRVKMAQEMGDQLAAHAKQVGLRQLYNEKMGAEATKNLGTISSGWENIKSGFDASTGLLKKGVSQLIDMKLELLEIKWANDKLSDSFKNFFEFMIGNQFNIVDEWNKVGFDALGLAEEFKNDMPVRPNVGGGNAVF